MAKHIPSTHRGNCQVCGHLQAVQAPSGLLAKHGYKVKGWGYFVGTCKGSDRLPLQLERTLTDSTCAMVASHAQAQDNMAASLREGMVHPLTVRGSYDAKTRDYVRISWEEADALQRSDEVKRAVWSCENEARSARDYVKMMQKLATDRFGGPLSPILKGARVEPVKPTVDVKTATVTGKYATKAARQADLDKLSRQYEGVRKLLQDIYLNSGDDIRNNKEATELYYAAQSLSQWRPKHSALALKLYGAKWAVEQIESLVRAREAVKNA